MNWAQLRTILWLRWRLAHNQWTRSRGLGAVWAVLVTAVAVVLGGTALLGGFLGGLIGLADASPVVIMLVWLGITVAFLMFWTIGLLSELQRSETIDLQRLLHLPVALGQLFVINYLVSHLALSVVAVVPGMLGLAAGLAFSRGPAMLLVAPLALGVVFMITAWTYCLRGWLATMMANPRRRRTIVMAITALFILLAQGPNLYFNVIRRLNREAATTAPTSAEAARQRVERKAAGREALGTLAAIQPFIPPFWLPVGARALAENRLWPALLGTLGCVGIGALGLQRAYRSTIRFYRGGVARKTPARPKPAPAAVPVTGSARFLERRLPGVPEPAAALALATFRSLLRAPEVKMAWASSVVVTMVLGGSLWLRAAPTVPDAAKPFAAIGAVALVLFTLVSFLANQFGYDRDGFRALVLSPAERRWILLGKNLASLPVGGLLGLSSIGLISVRLGLPPAAVAAAVLQLLAMLILAALGGNLLSILVPYRIAAGSMKPTKLPPAAMIGMVLCQCLFPLVLTPVLLPPLAELLWRLADLPRAIPINLLLSGLLVGVAAFGYWVALPPLGRWLQRRETMILSTVSAAVE